MVKTAHSCSSARRSSSRDGSRVSTTHAAPASMAWGAYSLPSTRSPSKATKIESLPTSRESMTTPRQVLSALPVQGRAPVTLSRYLTAISIMLYPS